VVTEFQAAIPAVFIGLLAMRRRSHENGPSDGATRNQGERDLMPLIARIALGVTIAAIPLLIYNALAFGSPFHIGYASEEGFQELHSGFFGITSPSLSTVRELLFGAYRGLLPLSPLMAAVPVGLMLLGRQGQAGPALVAGGVGLYYLLLNASYFYWEGGWASARGR